MVLPLDGDFNEPDPHVDPEESPNPVQTFWARKTVP